MKTKYNARWFTGGLVATGNVDFFAASDSGAIKKADQIGREIGLPNSCRTIYRDGMSIHTKMGGAK